jgi:peptide/nickel transport system substrate-binding protein
MSMARSRDVRNPAPVSTVRAHGPKAAALAIAALGLALLLSACGGSGGSSTAGSTQAASDSGTPVHGGVLRFARSLDADQGLDPISGYSNGSIFIITQIFDQLVELGEGTGLQPGLATKWEHSGDGRTWTFHLRKAEFSNGEPVTAQDVKFSIERWANPEIDVANAALGESVEKVEVVDPSTVRVKLSKIDAPFIDYLSTFSASIVPQKVVEEEGEKEFSEHPVGSGPFEVKEYVRGQRTVLQRNPHYWRKGQPYLDGVVFEYVPDANTRVLKVRSGEADVADAIPYNQVSQLEAEEGLEIQAKKTVSWDSIFFNLTKKPLQDEKVRQALNYATPKEQILETVLYGNAQISNDNIPPLRFWDESLAPYPYDLEKAKELMAESSVPNGFKLELVIASGDPVELQTAEILKEEWAKIGVDLNIVVREFGTMFAQWIEGKGGMAATFPGNALSSNSLADDEMAAVVLDSEAGVNSLGTYYDNPKVNALVDDARGTLNEARRRKDFAEIQRIALEDPPAVPLFFTESVTAVRDNVKGFTTYPIGWWPLHEVWLEE